MIDIHVIMIVVREQLHSIYLKLGEGAMKASKK
jgi:hypothetical protein